MTLTAPSSTSLDIADALPLSENPAAVYLSRLAPGSRRTLRAALATIAVLLTGDPRAEADALDWGALRYQHTNAIRAQLAERYATATANKAIAALRGVLKEAWRLGRMSAEDYHRAADLATIRGETLPRGRGLSAGELRALFGACADDDSPTGRRDAALLAITYGCGLRRSEPVKLDLDDVDLAEATMTIRRAKGNKYRRAFLDAGTVTALSDWLAARGTEPGPLFHPITKGKRIIRRRLTDQAVLYILAKRADTATVAAFSPHDLRRSFISDLLDAGADVSTVKDLAGHSSVTTTTRYDRRGEVTRRKAAGLIRVPFVAHNLVDRTRNGS